MQANEVLQLELDLFGGSDDKAPPPAPAVAPVLNGMYYERSTDMFVSYVLGRRYHEEPAKGCGHLKEWQNRIRRERAI